MTYGNTKSTDEFHKLQVSQEPAGTYLFIVLGCKISVFLKYFMKPCFHTLLTITQRVAVAVQ